MTTTSQLPQRPDYAPEVRAMHRAICDELRARGATFDVDGSGVPFWINGRQLFVDAYVHKTTRDVSIAVMRPGSKDGTRWSRLASEAVAIILEYCPKEEP